MKHQINIKTIGLGWTGIIHFGQKVGVQEFN